MNTITGGGAFLGEVKSRRRPTDRSECGKPSLDSPLADAVDDWYMNEPGVRKEIRTVTEHYRRLSLLVAAVLLCVTASRAQAPAEGSTQEQNLDTYVEMLRQDIKSQKVAVISVMIAGLYLAAQTAGAFAGVGIANLMFGLPLFFASTKIRGGGGQFLGEVVATFGLIGVIRAGVRFRPKQVAWMVGSFIAAAYWFTSSTSFANPAVALARSASNTFSGIAPRNVPMFLLAQMLGAFAATFVFNWLLKEEKN